MPFQRMIPHAFTAASVQGYAPALPGVYGISNSREWLYIDRTDNIQAALANHLNHAHSPLMKRAPAGFVFEVCSSERQDGRCDRLIAEYSPICGRVIGRPADR